MGSTLGSGKVTVVEMSCRDNIGKRYEKWTKQDGEE